MSGVRRHFRCPPEAVFRVLTDGWTYPVWVVGASRMRSVDPTWPAVGAHLHHSAGLWPLLIDDSTELLAWDPPRHLALEARGWPAGTAVVRLTVEEDADGCTVAMAEDVNHGPSRIVPKPLRQLLMRWRNTESLRRLAYLAEGSKGSGG